MCLMWSLMSFESRASNRVTTDVGQTQGEVRITVFRSPAPEVYAARLVEEQLSVLPEKPGNRTLTSEELTSLDETVLHDVVTRGGAIVFGADGTVALSKPLRITRDTVLDGAGHWF